MKLWEYRIKQYTYDLEETKLQKRSRQNYEVEEIINVISEPILDEKKKKNGKFLRTFFLKKERIQNNS